MITYDEYMQDVVKDPWSDCWMHPTKSSKQYVTYKDNLVYIKRAIFDKYGKVWDGITKAVCGNSRCLNPSHLHNSEQMFWSHVEVGETDECWWWKASKLSNDYGSTRQDGKFIGAHRKAYQIAYGIIPEGLYVCHSCDNPACCNPSHLFLGTRQDNVDDRERKGRNKLPHSLGESHGQSKLTERDVKEIRRRYFGGGETYDSLAECYGVSFGNIRKIIKRETWEWLQDNGL